MTESWAYRYLKAFYSHPISRPFLVYSALNFWASSFRVLWKPYFKYQPYGIVNLWWRFFLFFSFLNYPWEAKERAWFIMTNWPPYLALCLLLSFCLTHRRLSRTWIIITARIIFKMMKMEKCQKIEKRNHHRFLRGGLARNWMYLRFHFCYLCYSLHLKTHISGFFLCFP